MRLCIYIYTLNPVESNYRDGPTAHKNIHIICTCNVILYIYIYSIYIRAGTKVAKQHSKQKQTNIQRVCKYFYQIALTFIGYTMPPKLDYCFITSTSLVPVAVSTWIQHRWTEK